MMQADCRCGNVRYEVAEELLEALKTLREAHRNGWTLTHNSKALGNQALRKANAAIRKAEEK